MSGEIKIKYEELAYKLEKLQTISSYEISPTADLVSASKGKAANAANELYGKLNMIDHELNALADKLAQALANAYSAFIQAENQMITEETDGLNSVLRT